jgi:hypothetical protein
MSEIVTDNKIVNFISYSNCYFAAKLPLHQKNGRSARSKICPENSNKYIPELEIFLKICQF